MAAIVAADVTWSMFEQLVIPKPGQNRNAVMVTGRITIDPGTTDTYPTGGIPLTNVFTADTGLDTTKRILGFITPPRNTAGVTVFTPAHFANDIATGTPAAQKLVLLSTAARATITATTIAVASSTSITDSGSGFVTAGFKVGDTIVISGFLTVPSANGTAVITAVAAGTLTVTAGVLDADTAGDTVNITALDPLTLGLAEYPAADVTLAGGIAAGDENIVLDVTFIGTGLAGV